MSSIVIDYRKCVSTIDSCLDSIQLINCDKLVDGFKTKHKKEKTSLRRSRELTKYITLKLKGINCLSQ